MDREPARSFEDLIAWQKAHANPWRVRFAASSRDTQCTLSPISYFLT